MGESQLTGEQQARMNAIIEEWGRERLERTEKVPKPKYPTFDGERTRINIELEKKYMPMLQAILEE